MRVAENVQRNCWAPATTPEALPPWGRAGLQRAGRGQACAGGPRGGCAVQAKEAGRVAGWAWKRAPKIGAGDTAGDALANSSGLLATHNVQQSRGLPVSGCELSPAALFCAAWTEPMPRTVHTSATKFPSLPDLPGCEPIRPMPASVCMSTAKKPSPRSSHARRETDSGRGVRSMGVKFNASQAVAAGFCENYRAAGLILAGAAMRPLRAFAHFGPVSSTLRLLTALCYEP